MKKIYPIYLNKRSPCYSRDHLGNIGCPARSDIARFLYSISRKDFLGAFEILKLTNPFSGGCGRFCDHPCEFACNRSKFDEAVDIKELERFASDYGFRNNIMGSRPSDRRGKSVAIVGSGPGGLSCGYFLSRLGYDVDVFEREGVAGGILSEGIPTFRYPRDILEYELNYIKSFGLQVNTGCDVGSDLFGKLVEDYDAVIVATGAHRSRSIGVGGDDLDGVLVGLDFLKRVHFDEDFVGGNYGILLKKFGLGKDIAVIGGGYTAFDVARVGVRLGASPHIYYRRSALEMTAHSGELEEAGKEGIGFSFLVAPVEVRRLSSGRLEMLLRRMELGDLDASGRPRPVPIMGSEYTVEVDNVVSAIGELPDLGFLGGEYKVEGFRLLLDRFSEDLRRKVFITGDALQGEGVHTGMVVRAVGLAQDTVMDVRVFLGEVVERLDYFDNIAFYDTIKKRYFGRESRIRRDILPFEDRVSNFAEVNLSLGEDLAVAKAGRCWNCGICIQCDWCRDYANDAILKLSVPWDAGRFSHFYKFVRERVGFSTRESVSGCPRNAMALVPYSDEWKDEVDGQYISFDMIKY